MEALIEDIVLVGRSDEKVATPLERASVLEPDKLEAITDPPQP